MLAMVVSVNLSIHGEPRWVGARLRAYCKQNRELQPETTAKVDSSLEYEPRISSLSLQSSFCGIPMRRKPLLTLRIYSVLECWVWQWDENGRSWVLHQWAAQHKWRHSQRRCYIKGVYWSYSNCFCGDDMVLRQQNETILSSVLRDIITVDDHVTSFFWALRQINWCARDAMWVMWYPIL